MSLQRSKTTVPYTVAPETVTDDSTAWVTIDVVAPVTISIPLETMERIHQKLKQAERPLVSFQDEFGEMFRVWTRPRKDKAQA